MKTLYALGGVTTIFTPSSTLSKPNLFLAPGESTVESDEPDATQVASPTNGRGDAALPRCHPHHSRAIQLEFPFELTFGKTVDRGDSIVVPSRHFDRRHRSICQQSASAVPNKLYSRKNGDRGDD